MRTFFLSVFVTVILGTVGFGQGPALPVKLADADHGGSGGCDDYFRITYLLEEMDKNAGSTGLVVVYAGQDQQRFGNLEAYIREADRFFTRFVELPKNKLSFLIAEGKDFFNEELWLIPAGSEPPMIPGAIFDWDKIGLKYHFSNACPQCEPSYPFTRFEANFETYADILKKHPEYLGRVDVHNYDDLRLVRHALTASARLSRDRYQIRVLKTASQDPNLNIDLYLLPMRARANISISKK